MNQLNAIGRTGKDAELRYTPAGDAIASWSVALTSGYGDKAITTWVNCSLFGKRAEKIAPMITKGSQIGITGEILLREYESNGSKKQSLDCRVSDVTLLGSKNGATGSAPQTSARPNEQKGSFDDFEDDIPF